MSIKTNIFNFLILSFIYLLAIFELLHSTVKQILYLPNPIYILSNYKEFIINLLNIKFFQILTNSNNFFNLIFFAVEFLVIRPIISLSKIVKYNLVLILIIILLKTLLNMFCEIFFNDSVYIYNNMIGKHLLSKQNNIPDSILLCTFIIYSIIYIYLYLLAIFKKYPVIPYFEAITDSVAFWLRIKTPTMRVGKF